MPETNKFEKFKNFLPGRKAVMEVLESMDRIPGNRSSSRCDYSNKPGHSEENG